MRCHALVFVAAIAAAHAQTVTVTEVAPVEDAPQEAPEEEPLPTTTPATTTPATTTPATTTPSTFAPLRTDAPGVPVVVSDNKVATTLDMTIEEFEVVEAELRTVIRDEVSMPQNMYLALEAVAGSVVLTVSVKSTASDVTQCELETVQAQVCATFKNDASEVRRVLPQLAGATIACSNVPDCSTTTTTTTTPDDDLSGGAIAGIVLGSLAGAALLGGAAYMAMKSKAAATNEAQALNEPVQDVEEAPVAQEPVAENPTA